MADKLLEDIFSELTKEKSEKLENFNKMLLQKFQVSK